MILGVPKENRANETRVACSPETVKKLVKKGIQVKIQKDAGVAAGFSDADYQKEGAEIAASKSEVLGAEVIFKFHRPIDEEISFFKRGSLLLSYIEPFKDEGFLEKIAA